MYFFYSKYVSRSIRDIFRELASTPIPVKSGAFIIWSKFLNIIKSQDICEYLALCEKITPFRFAFSLPTHICTCCISMHSASCNCWKSVCQFQSHCDPWWTWEVLWSSSLDYKYLTLKTVPICFGDVWPTCFQKCLNWLTCLFIFIFSSHILELFSFLSKCALMFLHLFLTEQTCYAVSVPTNPL